MILVRSSVVEEYMIAVENLASQVLEILTEGLGLEPSCFSQYLRHERMTSMRFNFYPPCPEPSLAIGLRAHTDPHLLTILHQDSVPGLQVQMGDKWITVKPRPDCFVVNIGDLFQVLDRSSTPLFGHWSGSAKVSSGIWNILSILKVKVPT